MLVCLLQGSGKMTFVFVKLLRLPERLKLSVRDFSETILDLKIKIADETGIPCQRQKMIYWGQILEDSKPLQSYNLRNNCTIYIIPLEDEDDSEDLPVVQDDEVNSAKLATVLETAIKNPLYKHSVRKILQDSEALEQIVAATSGLRDDHVAMTLLKDPELLLQVSDTANVERIVQEHPALAQAASHIIAAITEDTAATRQLLQDRRNLGEDSEDELQEFDPEVVARAELTAAAEEHRQENQGEGTNRITPAQLASALTQAGYRPNNANPSNPGPSRPRQNIITSEFFSQALSSAISSTMGSLRPSGPVRAPSSNMAVPPASDPVPQRTPPSNVTPAALQQMRDMGITDDELSARALEVSGGNIEAALNLIFEGGLD